MLREHRIDHLRERFVGRPPAVAPREQVALKPSLAAVLAENLHNASLGADVIVDRNGFGHAAAIGRFEYGVQAIRIRFVRTEQSKYIRIHFDDVTQEFAELARRLGDHASQHGTSSA